MFYRINKYIHNVLPKSNNTCKNNILDLLNFKKTNTGDYCFLLDCGTEVKISEIPIHYLKNYKNEKSNLVNNIAISAI